MTERPPHDWGCELALLMARARNGEAVYMDGSHDPRPSEWKAAREFVDRIRADERAKAPTHATGTSTGDGPCCQCCYDVPVLRNDHRIARRRVKQLVDERERIAEELDALLHRVESDEAGHEVTWVRYADVCDLLGGGGR